MKSHSIQGLTFSLPTSGVRVHEVGASVYGLELSDPSVPDGLAAWITLYFPSAEAVAAQADPLSWFKALYLGSAKPPEREAQRTLLGQPVTGHFQQVKIPRKLALEAYRLDVPKLGTVFVGFRRNLAMDEQKAEAFFSTFASSLSVSG